MEFKFVEIKFMASRGLVNLISKLIGRKKNEINGVVYGDLWHVIAFGDNQPAIRREGFPLTFLISLNSLELIRKEILDQDPSFLEQQPIRKDLDFIEEVLSNPNAFKVKKINF